MSGCASSSDNRTTDPTSGASTTIAATASGAGTAPESTSTPGTEPLQTGVSASVIDTPPEILAKASTPALATDEKLAPTDRSIVLTAAMPNIDIYESATSTTPSRQIANPLPSGSPLTFLVDSMTSTRYKVLLPVRPNGTTGWVNPAQVTVNSHQFKIVIELSALRITVTNGDAVILASQIGVGKDATPTPGGRYYIKELIRPCYKDGTGTCVQRDDGLYGPFAYGLNGFSPVLTNFRGGRGEIGIHGTNAPDSIGKNVSNGCIRVSNSDITKLARILPLGTPVIVKA